MYGLYGIKVISLCPCNTLVLWVLCFSCEALGIVVCVCVCVCTALLSARLLWWITLLGGQCLGHTKEWWEGGREMLSGGAGLMKEDKGEEGASRGTGGGLRRLVMRQNWLKADQREHAHSCRGNYLASGFRCDSCMGFCVLFWFISFENESTE